MNRGIRIMLVVAVAAGAAALLVLVSKDDRFKRDTDEVEQTGYQPSKADEGEVFVDDSLEDKARLAFDPKLVDRRPLGPGGEWLLNASAAVVRLDVPMIKRDQEPHLLTLHSSYAAAAVARAVLPSVNAVDGKAKQFDDGLYAAIDRAYYKGLNEKLVSHVKLVRRLYDASGPDSVAAPFLAAGLELAGIHVAVTDRQAQDRLLTEFQGNEAMSKPIGFYTWNKDLSACFRFVRFFQREFGPDELAVPVALAGVLQKDPTLLADYRTAVTLYARLTNPYICLSVADLARQKKMDKAQFKAFHKDKKVWHSAVALFPPSSSRETVLFEKLFPQGLPPEADLMKELVRRLKSGEVDLKPKPDSGWYDHQVYALETLLLPERGEEKHKLLLSKAYKKRMLEAFQALMTTRRETHVRSHGPSKDGPSHGPPPRLPDSVELRLRLEPCPSYCLRTARAYSFLANFLEATLGKEALRGLHGLKQAGERKDDLYTELLNIRDLFYGLYLVSAEDIGLKPGFAPGEPVEVEKCYDLAAKWLSTAFQDEDLRADTRVAVPVYVDPRRRVTRAWVTLGVRLSKLEASYARAPSIKPAEAEGEWKEVEDHRLGKSEYFIPVDEFAEVELPGLKVLTRDELRQVCDREKSREAILRALLAAKASSP